MIGQLLRFVRHLFSAGDTVYDLSGTGISLPLALREATGIQVLANQVAKCKCGVNYFIRPTGSEVPENGECRQCAQGVAPVQASAPARVVTMRKRGR